MPPLTDPERCQCYRNALANWRYAGYIVFTEQAWHWLAGAFDLSAQEIAGLLHAHVQVGGCQCVDEQVETRPEWIDMHDFHHDLRVRIAGRHVYFETRLCYDDPDDPDDPIIQVVNAHDV